LDIDCCRYSHLLTAVTALANSPPLEVRHVVRAVFLTFPVNLVFLPAALVLVSFIARQAVVLVTLPAAVRRFEAHRERTRLWWWALLAALVFDAVALIGMLSIFAAS
jgi:hypothetical protein